MRFTEGLYHARSTIIFILGLIAAFCLILWLEALDIRKELEARLLPEVRQELVRTGQTGGTAQSGSGAEAVSFVEPDSAIPAAVHRNLNDREQEWARIAWTYFRVNYQPKTGLVNSVDGYPATTLWDTASYLMALIAVHRLEMIPPAHFADRMSLALKALGRLPLFEGKLPNKSYNTMTLEMVDYNNRETERGIGWSAIDIGRILVPFAIIVWNYPGHTEAVRQVIDRWDFDALLENGNLIGARVSEAGETEYVQEGRLGYEEYAAKSLNLMGRDVSRALRYLDHIGLMEIYDVPVPYDSRSPDLFEAQNFVVSEPYILDGIEFGWDRTSAEFAWRIYQAQEARFRETGILTAVSEDHIDRPPYFVYNTVFTGGRSFVAVTETGEDASEFKTLSTKAAIGWHVLYDTPYTERLVARIDGLHHPQKGWYSGRYEATETPNRAITCNTNGIILESLCFRKYGRMVSLYPEETEP